MYVSRPFHSFEFTVHTQCSKNFDSGIPTGETVHLVFLKTVSLAIATLRMSAAMTMRAAAMYSGL